MNELLKRSNEAISSHKRMNELGDEANIFRTKIKKRCFICEGMGIETICNPSLDFWYYCLYGNCCRACSAEVNNKMKSPEGRAFRSNIYKTLKVGKTKETIIPEEIIIPEEE